MSISASDRIAALAEPLARSLGLTVWGVELAPAGRTLVRVYVDTLPHTAGRGPEPRSESPEDAGPDAAARVRESGVSIDQCGELSRLLGAALEMEDALPGAYVLEVSSPGLERPFFAPAQLAGYAGDAVEVHLRAPKPEFPGRRHVKGLLVAAPDAPDQPITVAPDVLVPPAPADAPLLRFTWEDVKRMRRVHLFPDTRKPGKP